MPAVVPRPFAPHFGRRTVMMSLLLCAAGVPLLPTNEMKVAGTVWVTGCVLMFGVYVAWRSREPFGRTALDLPVLAFFGAAVLATIFGVNPRLSTFPNMTRGEGLLDYVVYAAAALAAARLSRSEAREILAVLLGAGALIGAAAAAQYYGFDPTTWIGSRGLNYGIRSWGTLANPDFLGGYAALVLPVGVSMACTGVDRPLLGNAGRQWWACGAAVILLYAALLASQTRSAWAAEVLAVGVLLWRLPRTKAVYRRLAVLALVCLAVTAFMIATQPRVSLGGRAESAFNAGDSSMQGKLWIWEHVLPMIRQRPLLGWGFSAVLGHLPGLGTPSYYRVFGHAGVFIDIAHNDLLQVAVNMGLIGVAAYLWIWGTVFRALSRAGTDNAGAGEAATPEAAGLLAGFAAYFVWLQFLWSHIGDANVFWVLTGIAISMTRTMPRPGPAVER